MKNLVLSTLIAAVASQAAGCIIFSDDDGTTTDTLGDIRLSWNLKSTNVDAADHSNPDTVGACPAGADTITLFALRAGDNPADAFQDKYLCTDGAGVLADLEPGNYTVWLQLNNHEGTVRFAESFSQDVTVFAGNVTSTPVDLYVDRGFVSVGWTLTGRITSCATANGGVSILATNSGGAQAFDTVVDCEEGLGRETITQPIPSVGADPRYTGTYTVALSLLAPQGGGALSATTTVPGATVDYGNALESIGIKAINTP
jgi:hypothetical protein